MINSYEMTLKYLTDKSQLNGFITEDYIISVCEKFNLQLKDFDKVYDYLQRQGIIINEDNNTLSLINSKNDVYLSKKAKVNYDNIFKKALEIEPNLRSYIDYLKTISPPQRGEERELIYQAKKGNDYAKNRLISMYLKVALRIAISYYKKRGYELSDSIQYGNIGLILAVDKMPVESKYRYSTYAPWWVMQVIERNNCYTSSGKYVPVHVKDEIVKFTPLVESHYCELCSNNYRNIWVCKSLLNEISQKLSISYEKTAKYLRLLEPILKIEEAKLKKSKIFSDHNLLIEMIDEEMSLEQLIIVFDEILNSIKNREREVIEFRFGFKNGDIKTLEEVGTIFGVTRERIRQIEAKALRKLRHPSLSKKLKEFY